MEFTRSKTRQIYASHLIAALVSAVALVYLLLKHVPHGTLYWVQLGGFVGFTVLILSFPVLSGRVKSGQWWSGQNRPTDVARNVVLLS